VKRHKHNQGFTLAELLVATILLSIVMTSVYTLFFTTIGAWRAVESDYDVYQSSRNAMTLFAREWDNMVTRAGHLLEGEDNEITMYVVTEPMEVEDDRGRRMMQVRYRYNRTAEEIIREERKVETALPNTPAPGTELDRNRIKLGPREEFVVATKVRDFKLAYLWLPVPENRNPDTPPTPITPVLATKHRERWGYPQGIEITLKLENPKSRDEDLVLRAQIATRGGSAYRSMRQLEEMLGSAL
jgi:prepilin-type N-terminal cleavage/methylation domain-containing protein